MPLALWPTSLPASPLLAGYSEQPRVGKVSFPTEVGPPIERPQHTVRLDTAQVTMDLTDEQLDLFKDFFWTEIGQGTAQFLIPHPRTQEQVVAKIIGQDGYDAKPSGAPGYWMVSFELMLWM